MSSTELRSDFALQKKTGGKHLVYKMHIDPPEPTGMVVVRYNYGSYGARGKSHIKCFHNDIEGYTSGKLLSAIQKAKQYVTEKYEELLSNSYSENPEIDESSYPIKAPGEVIYLEHRDPYTQDRSFYKVHLKTYPGSTRFFVETSEGSIGDRGQIREYGVDTLEEARESIAENVKCYGERGYKKKKAPKKLSCKVIDPWNCISGNESSGIDSDGDSDDDSDNGKETARRKKRGKKGTVLKTKKHKPLVLSAIGDTEN